MPSIYETLDMRVSNFNIIVATLGGFLSLFGLVSYLLKEKFYLGEARKCCFVSDELRKILILDS